MIESLGYTFLFWLYYEYTEGHRMSKFVYYLPKSNGPFHAYEGYHHVYMLNKIGPRTDPCGTPKRSFKGSDSALWMLTD